MTQVECTTQHVSSMSEAAILWRELEDDANLRDKVASGKDMGNKQGKCHKAKHENDGERDVRVRHGCIVWTAAHRHSSCSPKVLGALPSSLLIWPQRCCGTLVCLMYMLPYHSALRSHLPPTHIGLCCSLQT